jgi:uncharacterized membrane protein HdeD (DUF308 family)
MDATIDRNGFPVDGPVVRAGKFLTATARGRMVKGVLAIAFGVVLLAWPAPTVLAVVLTFGTFAVVSGISAVVDGIGAPQGERAWPIFQGAVDIAAGLVVWAWPGITALALLYVIAGWALVKGVTEVVAAFRLDELDGESRTVIGIVGLLTVAFGVIMFARPGAGALALLSLIAALAICTGVAFLVAGYRLGHARKEARELLTR